MAPALAAWAALAVGAPTPARAQGEATLQIDLAADELYRRCLDHIGAGRRLQAQACLQTVIEQSPESTAALKAGSALNTLRAQAALETSSVLPADRWPFKPGRLELSVMSGLMGVWTGGALAAAVGSQPFAAQGPILPMLTAGGGAVAVALGGGFALGSFFLGEFLDLKGGTSRLLGSGMFWGTALGVALAPWMFALSGSQWDPGSIVPNTLDLQRGVPLSVGVTLVTGYAGLAASAGAAFFLDLSQGQVSTLNTGIWSGLVAGMLTSPLLGLLGAGAPWWLGFAWITGGFVGGAAGAGMAFLLDFDVWEVLCIDAAGLGALALVGGSAGAVGFLLGNQLWINAMLATITGGAMLAALGVATAGMAFWRIRRGERVSRVGFLPIDELFSPPTPEVVYDKRGRPTPIAGLVKVQF